MRPMLSKLAVPLLAVSLLVAGLLPTQAQSADYSQAKLEAFVKAALHVEAILTRWKPQIASAEGERKEAIKKQVNAELQTAINQADGITLEEYGQIVQATREDQALAQRVGKIYQDMKPK